MQCPRTADAPKCPFCDALTADPCPLTEKVDLPGEPITAGTTGVCAIDNETCESCQ